MDRAGRLPEGWLLILAGACLVAWLLLGVGANGLAAPLCSESAGLGAPLSDLDFALALNSPARLVTGSALMVAATMAPLLVAPLRHVRDRSFRERRLRSMAQFVAGYAAVWVTSGVALEIAALAARSASPQPLVLAAAAALVWQVSPTKQSCLNAFHRRPNLAAFGLVADRDAVAFGLSNGVACVGACWALMLAMFSIPHRHLLAMSAIALFVAAERLERPGPLEWRLRGPWKAMRIVLAQTRMRLTPGV
jgi:predicted metal-binding membrane protein